MALWYALNYALICYYSAAYFDVLVAVTAKWAYFWGEDNNMPGCE